MKIKISKSQWEKMGRSDEINFDDEIDFDKEINPNDLDFTDKKMDKEIILPIELEEAKIAINIIKSGGSLAFAREIKNNPKKYPNLFRMKYNALRNLFHVALDNISDEKEGSHIGMGYGKKPEFRPDEKGEIVEFANTNKGVTKMKIKLSKSQWEIVGRKTGWMKKAGKDLGEIGTISLFAKNIKDATTVGSMPIQLELNFKDLGGVVLDSNSSPQIKYILEQLYKIYKQQVDAAYQEGNTGFGKNIKPI